MKLGFHSPFRILSLVLFVACLGNCRCDGGSENNPTNNDQSDAADTDRRDTNERPDAIVPDNRNLLVEIPISDAVGNRVEDPDFTLQNGGWFIRDGDNRAERVQRVYEWPSVESRPFISILPSSNAPVCAIGRVKFGSGEHQLRLSISAQTDDVAVSIVAISGDDYVRQSIAVTGETSDIAGRSWTTIEEFVGPYYGWGFLQICSSSNESVFVGAPSVRELAPLVNARVLIGERLPLTVQERARLRSLPSQVEPRLVVDSQPVP